MKILGIEITKSKKQETHKQKRSFSAASTKGIYSSWLAQNTSADMDIKKDLRSMRARSRELCRDDDYAKRAKQMFKDNVIGQKGITLQARAKDINGTFDKKANETIENAFKEWSRVGMCDVTGRYSLIDIQKMAIGAMFEDGEVLIRKVRNFPNKFGFALQIIEADHLDENFNDLNKNIHMGIECDEWGKPIAYHLFKKHPGENTSQMTNHTRERISADEIIHAFLPIRISATRGVPWMHTAITRMKMINGYEEAELVASRIAASKGGFYTSNNISEEYEGDSKDESGNIVNELEPGQIELLPNGIDFKAYDPQHPNAAFKDFMKVVLRGISSGLNIGYNTLANDYESVNYSSLRASALVEREIYKSLQSWMSEHILDSVFSAWLEMALLKQAINLPYAKYDKFNSPSWQPRGFQWVDPYKDMQANILAIKEGLKTHAQVLSEMGLDIEDVYAQLAREKELRQQYGITTISDAELLKVLAEKKLGEDDETSASV